MSHKHDNKIQSRSLGRTFQTAMFICESLRLADTVRVVYKDSGSFNTYLRPKIETLLKTEDYSQVPEVVYVYCDHEVIIHWKGYLNK
jgi:hypothetical protein